MVKVSRRRINSFAVTAVALGIAAGLWLVSAPSGIETYARGAPKEWAKLRQVHAEDPKQHLQHAYAPLGAVALDFQAAVIVGEDANFLGHGAWDVSAIREAVDEWWHGGGRLRGASTLTQQLAKNLFLSDARSWWRKLREARYAYWLEDRLEKRRILELYVNIVELGEGVFGVESASQHYFGVSAQALDVQQAAELAAAIPSPRRNNPTTRTAAWHTRYRAIRDRMERLDWVREELLAMMPSAPRARPPAKGAAAAASSDVSSKTATPSGAATDATEPADFGRDSGLPPKSAPGAASASEAESGSGFGSPSPPESSAAHDSAPPQAPSTGTPTEPPSGADTSAGVDP